MAIVRALLRALAVVGADVAGRGKRQDAERELAKQLTATHQGTAVEPSKVTVAERLG